MKSTLLNVIPLKAKQLKSFATLPQRLSSLLLLLLPVCLPVTLFADDSRPIFIQISEQGIPADDINAPTDSLEQQVEVLWKVPVTIPVHAIPEPVMPDSCQPSAPAVQGRTGGAYTFHQTYQCTQPLAAQTVGVYFPNINPGLNTLVRVDLATGERHSQILKPGELQWQIPESEDFLSVAKQYTLFGIEHIFAGIDHLLFVACLVFIAGTPRRIILTISGFTVAHSLTLALSALNLVQLPVPPVEAAIALSIVFLAHEIAVENKSSWTWHNPLLVSVSFGFLHGFGFAAVLREIGLPQTELVAGLLFFNIGVEIGQVIFVAAILFGVTVIGALLSLNRESLLAHRRVVNLSSYAIGITASYWLIERIVNFTV